jgi:hypothetical protein
VRLSPAQPLLAGFALTPLHAGVAGLLGGSLAMLASAASANTVPYLGVWAPYALDIWNTPLAVNGLRTLLRTPEAYLILLAWPLSAVVMSFFCRRATRLGAIFGSVVASAIFAGSHVLADCIAGALNHPQGWTGNELAVSVGASLILMMLVAILGAPIRAEKDADFDEYDVEEG